MSDGTPKSIGLSDFGVRSVTNPLPSSGGVDPLNLGLLAQKGSLYVTRPTLNTYGAKRENLVAMAKELFEVVQSGAVKIEVHQTYPLKDAAKAHADLAARKTTGSTVLLV